MYSDIAIKVEGLSKRYEIYGKPHDRLKQFIFPRIQRFFGLKLKQYFREFWALNDISFEIKKGETVAIIGRNGCGKSTLLQIICGTLSQTAGIINTNGRIAALLELGSGFNPEFTGRENVYMQGSIFGLTTKQIAERFDQIASFADIGQFIEQPVKTYSSGMFVRLAFASNIFFDPEIMIVDEALSVGDMNFQAKCMTALTQIQERGCTILFVSHDIGSVKSLCTRAIYLDDGKTVAIGPSSEIAELYIRSMREEMNEEYRRYVRSPAVFGEKLTELPLQALALEGGESFKDCSEFDNRVAHFRYGSGEVKVSLVEMFDLQGNAITLADFNQSVKVKVYLRAYTKKTVSVNISFFDEKKNNIIGCGFPHLDQPYLELNNGDRYLVEYLLNLPLQEGAYSLRVNVSAPIVENESAEFIDVVSDALVFKMNRWEKSRVWSKVHSFAKLKLKKFNVDDNG